MGFIGGASVFFSFFHASRIIALLKARPPIATPMTMSRQGAHRHTWWARNRKIVGDYQHPMWLQLFGILAAAAAAWAGWLSLQGIANLWK